MTILSFMNHTIFDNGACSKLEKTLKQCRIERPLLCTDIGLVKIGLVDEIKGALKKQYEFLSSQELSAEIQLKLIQKQN